VRDGLEVVAEFEELLEEFLGLDRIRFEDLFLEGRDAGGGVPDEVLEGAHHLSPDRGDQFERVRRAEVSAVEAVMDGVELAAGGVAGQGGAGGPEHGDDQVRVLEHLQRLEVQSAVAAAGQPVNGGVVVVGVEVQLGYRGPGVAVLDVDRAGVE
jgi:hypothetical protein